MLIQVNFGYIVTTDTMQAKSFFDPNAPEIVLKSLFFKYDKDGSGALHSDELRHLFEEDLGFDASEADAYALLLDKDGGSTVGFEEFVAWLKSGEKFQNINDKSRYHRLNKAVELFKEYDEDGSRSLGEEEFRKLHVNMGGKPEKTEAALNELDKDGNGRISFPEFLRWLNWVPMDSF